VVESTPPPVEIPPTNPPPPPVVVVTPKPVETNLAPAKAPQTNPPPTVTPSAPPAATLPPAKLTIKLPVVPVLIGAGVVLVGIAILCFALLKRSRAQPRVSLITRSMNKDQK
jgi:hypothetical protein